METYHFNKVIHKVIHTKQYILARKCNLHTLSFSECKMMSSPILSAGHRTEHMHKIIKDSVTTAFLTERV